MSRCKGQPSCFGRSWFRISARRPAVRLPVVCLKVPSQYLPGRKIFLLICRWQGKVHETKNNFQKVITNQIYWFFSIIYQYDYTAYPWTWGGSDSFDKSHVSINYRLLSSNHISVIIFGLTSLYPGTGKFIIDKSRYHLSLRQQFPTFFFGATIEIQKIFRSPHTVLH
jgi:hypothetical protein